MTMIKKKTSDLRLVLDGFKKIKYDHKKNIQDEEATTPVK